MGIHIRPVIAEDFDAVYRFICNLEEEIFDRNEFQVCFETCLASPHHYYFIAEKDGYAIGYISCHGQLLLHHCGMVYEIQELYVDYAHRKIGVGHQLIAAVESKLAGTGYKLLEVASGMQRADAHLFYKAAGFEQKSYKFTKQP